MTRRAPPVQVIDASGAGPASPLQRPSDLAVDHAGNLYVAGGSCHNVLKLTPGGLVTEIINSSGDGTHPLSGPSSLAVDGLGNVYVAGGGSANVFKVEPGGAITQIIDSSGDGMGHTRGSPSGVAAPAPST